MKKLLAVLMTVAMIVGVFTFGVSAETVAVDANSTTQVVGNRGQTGGPADGAADLSNAKTTEGTIVLNMTSIVDRYAVDIVFGQLEYTFNNGMIWDVNTYTYVPVDAVQNLPTINTRIDIVNHSNKSVLWKVKPEADASVSSYIELHCTSHTGGSLDTVNHFYYKSVPAVDITDPEKKVVGTDYCTVYMEQVDGVSVAKVIEEFGKIGNRVVLGKITVTVEADS